jgi:EC042_2821-lke REase
MIFKPSTSGSQSIDVVVGPSAAPRKPDLNSVDTCSDLIREIVGLATSGGGRLELRLIAGDESRAVPERVFSVRIESAVSNSTDSTPGATEAASVNLQPVRIVTDPAAPALQPQDVDRLYPWRQKDLLRELNSRLGRRFLNSYDIQAVRRQHRLDEHPDFVFNLPGAGRRYSPAAAEWIVEQHSRDPEFFQRARIADHEIMKLRRRKPK